jgi:manganese/zinc/iron transport system ATP- binding protein
MNHSTVGKEQGGPSSPLELHDLTVSYDHKPVLYGVDLEIKGGEIIGLMGPNGAGKSTLVKSIMGLITPNRGYVRVFAGTPKENRKRIGYVPQKEIIDWDFPITVYDVVLMGRYGHLGWLRRPGKHDHELTGNALEKVGMQAFARRQISELSGGQQQRVFLARALAQECDLYLLDEPFAGIDSTTERTIIALLHELRNQGKTILVVHHDLATAQSYFDSLILLNQRLVAFGPTASVFTPDILQKTYGGRLTILSEMTHQLSSTHGSR